MAVFPMKIPSALAVLAMSVAFAADRPEGVAGDGRTDDTAAIQAALDAAAKTGGAVELPPGKYLIEGALRVPEGVALTGSWQAPHHGAIEKGSTLLLTGGSGDENAPPAITLEQSAALRGFTLVWPEQKWPDIVPYPWAIQGVGMHNTVENVTFVNAYNGIRIGAVGGSELHLLRNIFGCVLRRGIFIDSTTDVGRIENVHFNPHYWPRSGHPTGPQGEENPDMAVARYMADHLEAFIFGRSDWQYVSNTFVFGAKVGYLFMETPSGATNGQFLGIGADYCRTCVRIEGMQKIGIQVTNGEFTSHAGDPGVAIDIASGVAGAAQFVNVNFWATRGGAARLNGDGAVVFSDCHFMDEAKDGVIVANAGRLVVRGSTFSSPGLAVVLGPGVRAAVLTGNLQEGGFDVRNGIGDRAKIGFNEE